MKENNGFTEILLRVPTFILDGIAKEIAKKPWTTRTQWILDAISKRLEDKNEDSH